MLTAFSAGGSGERPVMLGVAENAVIKTPNHAMSYTQRSPAYPEPH